MAERKLAPATPQARAAHDYHDVFLTIVDRLRSLLTTPMSSWRILDIGTGYAYPNTGLFSGQVARVCGTDSCPVFLRDGVLRAFRVGLGERHLRGAVFRARDYRWWSTYWDELARISGASRDHRSLSLFRYDGDRLPFEDQSFDAVISNAVIEHVASPEGFFNEVNRVLRPGGVVDMTWHNFYCPSGSHRETSSIARDPWGHLTHDDLPRVFLNKVTPDEVRKAAELHGSILTLLPLDAQHRAATDPSFEGEFATRLDAEYSFLLDRYPKSLLTTTNYLIQARKE